MDKREKLERAKQRVADLTLFYFHAGFYSLSALVMLAINYHTNPIWWAQFPVLIWGFAVFAHACAVFGNLPRFVERWQVRKIKKLLEDN